MRAYNVVEVTKMNTHLPATKPKTPEPGLLTGSRKAGQGKREPEAKTGQRGANLSLRYPKDLERCFVLGNN